ncbi:hypothetical protein INR49_013405 [Caranx melampygus]|nr:hypothetical protein INR49_013405 [Caranx melampygus]
MYQMGKMHLGAALLFAAVLVFPLQLECTTTCQPANQHDYGERRCPVKLTAVKDQVPGEHYSELVTVHVWIAADDLWKVPKIEIRTSFSREIIRLVMKKRKDKLKFVIERNQHKERVKCGITDTPAQSNTSLALWELVHCCVKADAGEDVSVLFSTTSTNCSATYTVPDPVPEFEVSVNQSSKSVTVTVAPGHDVFTRLCYSGFQCLGEPLSPQITIDPSQSPSRVLNIPYLLPCVCVQVYYTYRDARRRKECPFLKERVTDVEDVWRSSELTTYPSSLQWSSVCSSSHLKISASLCWRQHEQLCTPVPNATHLEEEKNGPYLVYNTSSVDKHPNMCVQLSVQGSHNISCPFQNAVSTWDVYIGPGRQSVFVYLTSLVPAAFSAQLCVLNEMGCSPMGPVHALTMVWQSHPALHGRRILCLDCWLYVQKPVLLVCSSEQSAHISAVCALASILQGELHATVQMALWAQTSQRQTGSGTGVADVGPLPWLYGQWENIRKAQGKVLIVWSPEAKMAYEKWKEERANMDQKERKDEDDSKTDVRHDKIRTAVEEDYKLNGKGQSKSKKDKAAGGKDCVELSDGKDCYSQREPSSVIAPVFAASLACCRGRCSSAKVKE